MRRIEPAHVRLRDGRSVILRAADEFDAMPLLDLDEALLLDGAGQVVEPGERTRTEEQNRNWVRELLDSETSLPLVAEHEQQLVGLLGFTGGNRRRMAHTGYIGLGLRPGWRSVGLGRAMLLALKDYALATQKIEKINLGVLANNAPAIALYTSVGFRENGRKTREFKLPDGSYVDDISMEWLLK